jgi:hypothetical protein
MLGFLAAEFAPPIGGFKNSFREKSAGGSSPPAEKIHA